MFACRMQVEDAAERDTDRQIADEMKSVSLQQQEASVLNNRPGVDDSF